MALRVRQEGWQGSLGGNVNQLANSERNISIGAPQPKGCRSRSTSATSRSLRLFAGNFSSRMWSIHWRTHSARFAEIRIASLVDDVPRRIPVCLTEADSFPSTWRTAIPPSPWFARGRSFPPEDRPPLLISEGQRRWMGMGHLNRRVWEAQSLSGWRFAEARAKRLSAIPITVGYRLHGER
jgi:hypothetical protein